MITLTTDFGYRDPFVGMMKGVILGIDPSAVIVDMTHGIAPQDIMGAALAIGEAHRYFPPGTIHVVVVDPGVGSNRRPIIVEAGGQYFVGPDNGVFTVVFEEHLKIAPAREAPFYPPRSLPRQVVSRGQRGARGDFIDKIPLHPPFPKGEKQGKDRNAMREIGFRAFHITRADIFLQSPGRTFDGRDVFAPVAARLSMGESPASLGTLISDPVVLTLPRPKISEGRVEGEAIRIDGFGNAITNIGVDSLRSIARDMGGLRVRLGQREADIVGSYSDGAGAPGAPHALINSSGLLEIFIFSGDASKELSISRGDRVTVSVAHNQQPTLTSLRAKRSNLAFRAEIATPRQNGGSQ